VTTRPAWQPGRPLETSGDVAVERRVLIVDDRLVAFGLQLALSARGWRAETDTADSVDAVIAHAERFAPACVLVDLRRQPAAGGEDGLVEPLARMGLAVVMLASQDSPASLAASLEAGAVGWVCKHGYIDDLVDALERVITGGSPTGITERETMIAELRAARTLQAQSMARFQQLTEREALVLGGLMEGLTADEIAATHFVALSTVRSQIRAVLRKLDVRSQLAAVAAAHRAGWTPEHTAAPVGARSA
jgi:two-component system nitrate/nitrite response regulator NarL